MATQMGLLLCMLALLAATGDAELVLSTDATNPAVLDLDDACVAQGQPPNAVTVTMPLQAASGSDKDCIFGANGFTGFWFKVGPFS